MRCDQCNKFVSFDDSNEPEINREEIDVDGCLSIDGRIYLSCADCGQELKEFNFEFEEFLELDGHKGHDLSVNVNLSEMTQRSEGKGRGLKTFYGVLIEGEISCSCNDQTVANFTLSDECQASAMDELV